MFIAFQIPFADERSFLPDLGKRLTWPTWPFPISGREFVRGFGQVRDRRRGGIENWIGEDVYCRARSAVTFDPSLDLQLLGPRLAPQRPTCVFRRLLANGGPVARLEIGLRILSRQGKWLIDGTECLELVRSCLKVSVRVPSAKNLEQAYELCCIGEPLARHYLNSSTPRVSGENSITEDWWITPGDPVLLIESRQGEVSSLPRTARFVRQLDFAEITIHHFRVEYRSRATAVWFLQIAENGDFDVVRRLRIHLLRLHAEIETLKTIFRAVIRQRLNPKTDSIQRYFQQSLRLLMHKQSHGFRQSEILRAALEWQELVSPGERETLLTKLHDIRPSHLRNIGSLTALPHLASRRPVELPQQIRDLILLGDLNMNQNITTSGIGNIVNVAEYMANVSNSVNQNVNKSQSSGEVKELIKLLMDRIATASSSVDRNIAKQMGDDVKVLSEEINRPEPRKKWYEFTLKSIKEAAEAIGEVGKPILETALRLLPILMGG